MAVRVFVALLVTLAFVCQGGSGLLFGDFANRTLIEAQGKLTLLQNRVAQLRHDIDEKIEMVTNRVEEDIRTFATHIRDDAQKVKEKALEDFKEVKECVDTLNNNIENLIEGTAKGAVGCVTDRVKEAVRIVQGLVSVVERANTTLADVQVQFSKCDEKSSILAAVCKTEVAVSAGLQEANLAAEAAGLIQDGITLVTTLESTVIACESTLFGSAALTAVKIGLGFPICLKDAAS